MILKLYQLTRVKNKYQVWKKCKYSMSWWCSFSWSSFQCRGKTSDSDRFSKCHMIKKSCRLKWTAQQESLFRTSCTQEWHYPELSLNINSSRTQLSPAVLLSFMVLHTMLSFLLKVLTPRPHPLSPELTLALTCTMMGTWLSAWLPAGDDSPRDRTK